MFTEKLNASKPLCSFAVSLVAIFWKFFGCYILEVFLVVVQYLDCSKILTCECRQIYSFSQVILLCIHYMLYVICTGEPPWTETRETYLRYHPRWELDLTD